MTSNLVEIRSVTDDLQQLIQDAENVEAPGDMKRGDIINRPDGGADDLPMAVGELEDAGYVMLFDIRDGRPFAYNRNMLASQLDKRDPSTGKKVFTTRDPGYRPVQGGYVCWLNPEYTNSEKLGTFGFRPCPKKGIPSEYEVQRHMRLKHGRQFDAINDMQARKREDDRDELNRKLLERAIGAPPVPVTVPDVTITSTEPDEPVEPDEIGIQTCADCGEVLKSKPAGMRIKMMHHRKKCQGAVESE